MTNPNTGKVPLTVPVTVNLPKPPEGMEWVENSGGGSSTEGVTALIFRLRPIVSATVMVEMTLVGVEKRAKTCANHGSKIEWCAEDGWECNESAACRAALARKPCPVMVCPNSLAGVFEPKCYDFDDRRPCKLAEGHGGEHE